MALFSWFIRRTNVKSAKNNKASLEQELSIFNNNTMWPVAKVRKNSTVQQQAYVKTISHFNKETKLNTVTNEA